MVNSASYQYGTNRPTTFANGDELTIADGSLLGSADEMRTRGGTWAEVRSRWGSGRRWRVVRRVHVVGGGAGAITIAVLVASPSSTARALVGDPEDGGPPVSESADAASEASELAEAASSADAAAPAAPPPRRSVLKDAQRALGLTLRREPTVRIGPRFGGTLNFDQWLLGGQILGDSIGIDALGLEAMFVLGIGGNHVTVRPAARVLYTVWIGGHRGLGIAPTVGASALIYVPVGDFAKFCNRVDLHGCGGWDLGMDVGGSLRFRWFRLEATLGFFGIPKATITFALDLPVGRSTEGGAK